MGDTKATAENGTEQRHAKEARRLAMLLRRRVWNGSTWEPEDKSVRILAAALAACAREATNPLCDALREINSLQHQMAIELDPIPQQPRIEFWTRKMEDVAVRALERAVGEKGQ